MQDLSILIRILALDRKRINLQQFIALKPLKRFCQNVFKIPIVSEIKIHSQGNADALFQQQPDVPQNTLVWIIPSIYK